MARCRLLRAFCNVRISSTVSHWPSKRYFPSLAICSSAGESLSKYSDFTCCRYCSTAFRISCSSGSFSAKAAPQNSICMIQLNRRKLNSKVSTPRRDPSKIPPV
jgi:hypothetical protein